MNKLEIKYFDNIELRLKKDPRIVEHGGYKFKYEIVDKTLNDFFEFYIDGKSLIQLIMGENKYKGFLESWNGLLGTRDKKYDELLVKSLMNENINIELVQTHFKKYNEFINDDVAKNIIFELCLEKPLIYGCKICGGVGCGGITIKIESDEIFFSWYLLNSETNEYDKLIGKFKHEEYISVFKNYMKNWKKAKTREINYH
jgi:hypothetical protein